MIIMITTLGMSALSWVSLSSNSPIKMSLSILCTTMLMMLHVKMVTGSIWFPLIYTLLFTGGILMMFMILASVLPNEKTMSVKIPLSIAIMAALSILLPSSPKMAEDASNSIKSFMTSPGNVMLMMMIILTYFFISMSLNNSEQYSMRSLSC